MKSFVLPKEDVKKFLSFLKIRAFKDNTRPFMKSISLWQIDGVNYICATDGISLFMMDAPNLGINISYELSMNTGVMVNKIKGDRDILFEVTEDDISAYIGDHELEKLHQIPYISRVIPDVYKFYKINEITLGKWGTSEYCALLNGRKKDGIDIKYLNFMYKNFKNIEFGLSGEDGDQRAYEFKNYEFRMIVMPVDADNLEILSLGEFKNRAKPSQLLIPELEKFVVNAESINEEPVSSFIVPNHYVINILNFFKEINNKNLNPENKGIRFFYRDGSIYVMCTDGQNTIFIEVEKQYNGPIDDSIQDTLFNISDISRKSELEVLVYESAISVNANGKSVSYVTKKTDFDFKILNKDVQKKDVNEIFLKYKDGRSKELFVKINRSFYLYAKIFDFFCEENILPKVSDFIKGRYNHVILSSSDVFVCAASSMGEDGSFIDVEGYYENVNTQRFHLSEYLLSLIKFPDITKQYKVRSLIRNANWIIPYNDKVLAIVDSGNKVIQPIDAPRLSYNSYKLSNNNAYGDISLVFDVNLNLGIYIKDVLACDTQKRFDAPSYKNIDKYTKNNLGEVFVYGRNDKRGYQEFFFELNGMLYPLWKLLFLESSKNLKYGFYYEYTNEYLAVTDGNLFVLFDDDIPLAYADTQVSADIIDSKIVPYRSSLRNVYGDSYISKFFEKIVKVPEREDIVEEGMVFSNSVNKYNHITEVVEQLGCSFVDEFLKSNDVKKIIDAIDVNIVNILRDYTSKIDSSIDARGLDFVANKIISKSGFDGSIEDLLIIMESCGINKEYILNAVHESVKEILSKNYGDF